jgi:ferredoxin--NADP+ reductase
MVAVLRELQESAQPESPNIIVNFRFGWTPSNFSGSQLEFVPTDGCGGKLALQTDSVITAIGFIGGEDDCLAQLASGKAWADASIGRIDSRLYCTGWLRRGAQGTIPENRNDARQVAEAIAASLAPANHGWCRGFDGLPRCVVGKAVSFEGWRAIDAIETATASEGRVRRKISNRTELLRIAAEASKRART